MIRSIKQEYSFGDYLISLRDSMHNLEEYWQKIGHTNPHIRDICKGLMHADPFITYKASIAATLLLNDNSIYH